MLGIVLLVWFLLMVGTVIGFLMLAAFCQPDDLPPPLDDYDDDDVLSVNN